jgi:hypothetical protein
MVKGEKTMNQGDGVKKEDRNVERHGKRRKSVFRRRQHTLRQYVRHENRGLQRIAGCGSEVGANINNLEGNWEGGMTGMEEMARGRQSGAEAQDEVERGGPGASVIWASTSARNLDVETGKTRKE